jgi:hypothetical protein
MRTIRAIVRSILFAVPWILLVGRCERASGSDLDRVGLIFSRQETCNHIVVRSMVLSGHHRGNELRGGGPKASKFKRMTPSKRTGPTKPISLIRRNATKTVTAIYDSNETQASVDRGILERNLWFAAEVLNVF